MKKLDVCKIKWYSFSVFLCFALLTFSCGSQAVKEEPIQSKPELDKNQHLERAYRHLYEIMDQYNNSFDVYTDADAGGNHFIPSGWMGDYGDIEFDQNHTEEPHSGITCIKITYSAKRSHGNGWAGIYWHYPEKNWGEKGKGFDLRGATKLTFWARGEKGGERAKFKVGGINRGVHRKKEKEFKHQDLFGPLTTGTVILGKSWKKYTISLDGEDLSNVLGGFCWVTDMESNLDGCTIYLDDIKYHKKRPSELRFLNSFIVSASDDEKALRNAALIYDNALVLLCFILKNDRQRAKIIADSFVAAQRQDRNFEDGRLRNAYRSGDLFDSTRYWKGALLSGWWNPKRGEKGAWSEDWYQVSTHTGNLAWVMLALLEYYKKYGGAEYLSTVEALASWVIKNTFEESGAGGYSGGTEGWKDSKYYKELTWRSTEHNLDLYVVFMRLFQITKDKKWRNKGLHAKRFVKEMWDSDRGHFLTGAGEDGITKNTSAFPLDVNTWGLMALGEKEKFGKGIDWAYQNCRAEHDSFEGFDFNDDKDGIWFEGTAQMVLALEINQQEQKAQKYLKEIERTQLESKNNNGKGIVSACHDSITTGFTLTIINKKGKQEEIDWLYHNRLHTGATAWYIFAKEKYNPFWGIKSNEKIPYGGVYD